MEPILLVSPTEPEEIRSLGLVSPLPEEYGCDLLFGSQHGLVGVQRKTVPDLIASLEDGRLAREVSRMGVCEFPILLVEGRPKWTADGYMVERAFRRDAWESLLMSAMFGVGLHVVCTDSLDDTRLWLQRLVAWFAKDRHRSLKTRPKARDSWGTFSLGEHLLQSFPGIGPELAQRIIRHFGGVPLEWTVTEREMGQVEGIGPARAKGLIRALEEIQSKGRVEGWGKPS